MDVEGCNIYLGVFADLNQGADHNCTYNIELLPESPSLEAALAAHFSKLAAGHDPPQEADSWHISVDPLNADWLSKIKPIAANWFFGTSFSPRFREKIEEAFVEGFLEQIHRMARKGAAFMVHADSPRYENLWDDIAIVADGKTYLLHFGCSD